MNAPVKPPLPDAQPVSDGRESPPRRQRIAIIGSGVSGSAAAWGLHRAHDVVLYEKAARPGGHTATVDIDYDGRPIAVDTGFIVYNEANYPNLTALFQHFGIATHGSDMSFSLSLDGGRLEWSGDNLATLFAQKRNLLRPSFLLMLREILRFNRICLSDRAAGHLASRSIGDYLDWRGFSPGFQNNYLVPMAAAIWSTPARQMLEFPASRFVNFFENHRLIHARRPEWRTVNGGSRTYLDKLLSPLGDRLRLNCGVVRVHRTAAGVDIEDTTGRTERFDQVIFACHTDQALAALAQPDAAERAILSGVPYRANRVILHRDADLMPKRRKVWASWNYLRSSAADDGAEVAVSYWMNRLQGIDEDCPLFVTLNPDREPAADKVFAEFSYDHPQFGRKIIALQDRLAGIQGANRTHFAGAWTGYGFHEDGLSSGIRAAEALGGTFPWRPNASTAPAPVQAPALAAAATDVTRPSLQGEPA
ncbi:NAD(P)/FAD-dependent oxidoreductase [Pseudohoeflea coraliihabitans]|uniref:FAD-dependent oxidoreductase n=1 Tax=Pseudohoeflea coraliihabitans TaxID=2860393 RepID=A0ABS6WQ62_9HYPH|nr:FAD-dependent oxidoreductase [Pseudohoeflea sp. DP4N28-3]MBW3098101.1 FAD-dependent oxidoreductase [Pseudohoeflea sp. DP4N28-3]